MEDVPRGEMKARLSSGEGVSHCVILIVELDSSCHERCHQVLALQL